MSIVFINFRGGDTQDSAVLVDQKLSRVLGRDRVFRSSTSIDPGVPFDPELVRAASTCAVMLVLIGPHWLTVTGGGLPRLHVPGDWVRLEIELALRNGARVVPVLVGDTRLPEAVDLPPTIAALAGHQYLRLHHRSAEYDLAQILDAVRPLVGSDGSVPPPPPADTTRLATLPVAGRSPDVSLGGADLNGRHYGDSVVYRCSGFCHEPKGQIEFNLGRRFRRFEATVGVLDDAVDAGQTGVFEVFVDGSPRGPHTAGQGAPRVVRLDVTDALRLRLVAYRPGTTAHPMLAGANIAGGRSNRLPELAWGNPTLYV
ncbi:TIR domain-containing protein [Nocardia sp. NRRL S-836]|uniref:TIR domain-containing protein n=1 Tax=Nocardia sp. NRRL S-836 TaxID=1519492 RepID=UPI0006AF1263|nr:TIR domain-containing protein [Nocardia sp. NRRL S-836]